MIYCALLYHDVLDYMIDYNLIMKFLLFYACKRAKSPALFNIVPS